MGENPGGYCHIWAKQVCATVKGIYKSERLGLEQGIIFQETDELVEDFIQTRDNLWYNVLFWLDCASDLSSFWKTATLGQGEFGEFTLVQGSKIQLNQLQYRLRVTGSQWHIPTKKFLKYPPGPHIMSSNDRIIN